MNNNNEKKATTAVVGTSDNKVIFARSIEEMRVSLVEMNRFVDEVMIRGEDYDTIPGCGDKPTLLKPGAEKLCQLYNYSPQFVVVESQISREFVRYLYKCRLIDKDGRVRGEGEGTANSEEPKFRREETIPFFKATEEQKALATRKEERVSKKGKKYIAIFLEASPLGMENTICKMAQKRAFVAATLCTTRLSNKFTQDVEDMSKSTFKNAEEVEAEVVGEAEGPSASESLKELDRLVRSLQECKSVGETEGWKKKHSKEVKALPDNLQQDFCDIAKRFKAKLPERVAE